MLLACGSCGIATLSNLFPPFMEWTWLLAPAAIILLRVESLEGRKPPVWELLIILAISFLAGLIMIGPIVWPCVVLTFLLYFLGKCFSKERPVRRFAMGILLAYLVTGLWAFYQARVQGKFWQLSRIQRSHGYADLVAKQQTFSDEELFNAIESEDSRTSRNAAQILVRRFQYLESYEQAKKYKQRIDQLEKEGTLKVEPVFWRDLDWAMQGQEALEEERQEASEVNPSAGATQDNKSL